MSNIPTVCRLASRHHWPNDALAQAIAASAPTPSDWQHAIRRTALLAGAFSFGVSVVFFVAYNWATMGRLLKFGLLQGLLCIAVSAGIVWRERPSARHAAMVASYFVLGALLALLGQTYQTGADPWQLFAVWATLGFAFAVAGAHGLLWSVWLATINVAMVLFFSLETRHGLSAETWRIPTAWIAATNLAFFASVLAMRHALTASYVATTTAASVALFSVSTGVIVAIITQTGERHTTAPLVTPTYAALYVASAALIYWLGWTRARSLLLLSIVAISVFAVGNTTILRAVVAIGDGWLALNVVGVAVIASAAGLAVWVHRAAQNLSQTGEGQ